MCVPSLVLRGVVCVARGGLGVSSLRDSPGPGPTTDDTDRERVCQAWVKGVSEEPADAAPSPSVTSLWAFRGSAADLSKSEKIWGGWGMGSAGSCFGECLFLPIHGLLSKQRPGNP